MLVSFVISLTGLTSVSTRTFIILLNESGDTPILGLNANGSGVLLCVVVTISAVKFARRSSEKKTSTKHLHRTQFKYYREKNEWLMPSSFIHDIKNFFTWLLCLTTHHNSQFVFFSFCMFQLDLSWFSFLCLIFHIWNKQKWGIKF